MLPCFVPKPKQVLSVPNLKNREEEELITEAIKDTRVITSETMSEQIFYLCTILRSEHSPPISYEKIGLLFTPHISHKAVIYHFESFLKQKNPPHCPKILSDEELQILKEKIKKKIAEKEFPSTKDIKDFIEKKFNKTPSSETIRNIIKNAGYKIVEARPIEEARYNVPPQEIEDFYKTLKDKIEKIPCGFVYNLDESGIQDYVDSRKVCLVIPQNMSSSQARYPVHRAGKHMTVLHCISTDGSYTTPS